jgi:hypothetical protein
MRQSIKKKDLQLLSDDDLRDLLERNSQRPRIINMPTQDRICCVLNNREADRVTARWAWEDAHGGINTKTAGKVLQS